MRVIVHRANRTLLKIDLHRHHLSIVRQNPPRHAITQILKRGLFVENKHLSAPLCNETMFHLTYLTLR